MATDDTGGVLPAAFCERLERLLPPAAAAAWREAFAAAPATAFRVNTLKADVGAVLEELALAGIRAEPLAWWPLAFTIPPDQRRRLTETPACRDGRLYVQNPSSMLPPLVLAPGRDEQVLDLAAAPGSKTLQLAALMGNTGSIAAVEAARPRFFRLRRNLALGGAANVRPYLRDGESVWRVCPERFDRVLLDAPCSGEGRFSRREPRSFAHWTMRSVRRLAARQRRLLFSAVNSLKVGGALVYSTCTLAPEENEEVVGWALARFGDALAVEPVDLPVPNQRPGLERWEGRELQAALAGARRVLPTRTMQAFFLCRLRKRRSTVQRWLGQRR